MKTEKRRGKIVGICTSPHPGLPKYPRTMAMLEAFGFRDDYHNNPLRRDFKNPDGPWIPNNDRQILIMGKEALDEASERTGWSLHVGQLGENILTEGLGNLSDIVPGSIITIGPSIRIRMVKQNKPCRQVTEMYTAECTKAINGRRGLLCAVEAGAGQMIFLGQDISILAPSTP